MSIQGRSILRIIGDQAVYSESSEALWLSGLKLLILCE